MVSAAQLSTGRIEKLLTQSIKQVLIENGIKTSTRSGNKELTFTVKKISSAPFTSEPDVQKAGTALGEKIAELSKQRNKQNLDAGVIRQLSFKKNWTAEFDIPEAPTVEPVSKKSKKSAQTVIVKPTEPVKSAPTPEPEPASEPALDTTEPDATAADEAEPAEIADEVEKDIEDNGAVGVADGGDEEDGGDGEDEEDGEVSAVASDVVSSEISDEAESTDLAAVEAPDTEETEEEVEEAEEEEPAVAAIVEEEVDEPQAEAPNGEVDADTTAGMAVDNATVDDENIDDEIVDVEVVDTEDDEALETVS